MSILAVLSKNLILLLLSIAFIKYEISFLDVANWLYKIRKLSGDLITGHIVYGIGLIVLLLSGYFLYKVLNKININKIYKIAIVVLLIDLIIFLCFMRHIFLSKILNTKKI